MDKDINHYQEEAKKRWGYTEAYKQSQERMKKLTKAQMQQIKSDGEALTKSIAENIDKPPSHPAVQALIAQHYHSLKTFYEPSLQIYEGLAKMYIEDPRFSAYYNKFHPNLAQFMHDAMLAYIETQAKN